MEEGRTTHWCMPKWRGVASRRLAMPVRRDEAKTQCQKHKPSAEVMLRREPAPFDQFQPRLDGVYLDQPRPESANQVDGERR